MESGIRFAKIWFDSDITELKITVSNGESVYSNNIYTSLPTLEGIISELKIFSSHIPDAAGDITLGAFGPEYANGGFRMTLHFGSPGTLFISSFQQEDFILFAKNKVAGEARFYLKAEPVMLDNFIAELGALHNGNRNEAFLKCGTL